ncbi:uncharacterized protein LOC133825228 [Humulus lupulus]|uniref:uncharacterized protein LOC133825228 n=1 Tax=Humulus lupulus TaxID=3486 RepID=UPI002B403549|nr:uncharacterized protein LOC133825228 [Humulus lupulus]
MAKELKARCQTTRSDSQLLFNQILGEYQAHRLHMNTYLKKAKDMLSQFDRYTIKQVPREKNSNADALAKLASARDAETLNVVPIKFLAMQSITNAMDDIVGKYSLTIGNLFNSDCTVTDDPDGNHNSPMLIDKEETWMTPFMKYLSEGVLPSEQSSSRKTLYQVPCYIIQDNRLYRRGHSMSLLRCVTKEEAQT